MRHLYFRDAADDALLAPVDNLIAICQTGDTTVTLYFKPRSNDAAEVDSVALTITDEKEVEVCEAIIDSINYSKERVLVVFDGVNSEALHADITASSITFSSLAD